MLGLILTVLVVGLIAGAIARLVVPGGQHMSILGTIVLGVVGSLVGGFLGYVLFGKDTGDGFLQPAGLIGSVIGAIIVLFVWIRAGSHRTARAPDVPSTKAAARRSRESEMPAPAVPRCPSCGEEMVLEMNPASPQDDEAVVLSADPPFRYGCTSPACGA